MRLFIGITRGLILGCCLIGFTGCEDKQAAPSSDVSADHGDHDHDDHDHGDHDHEGHDHGDHDHSDHVDAKAAGLSTDDLVSLDEPALPDNYNDAVAQLAKLTTTIADGFKNDKIDDAHGPLHDVSNLLEGIATLAKDSKMDADAKKSVSESIESLFDSFGAVDLKLHNSEKGKDYADVATDITEAMKTLQSFVKE